MASTPSVDIPLAPSPWSLKSQLWLFLYTPPPPSTATENTTPNPNNVPEILQGAPPGSYHPFESPHPSSLVPTPSGTFQLRTRTLLPIRGVVIVRYADSPVGPYDELMFIPGSFDGPDRRTECGLRITNIYVSTDASVLNGRRNWNIPKHRASFTFESLDSRRTSVRVSHPVDSPLYNDGKPFFAATLDRGRGPTIPFPPMAPFKLVQPPLLPSLSPLNSNTNDNNSTTATSKEESSKKNSETAVIGTADLNPWLSISPLYRGSWRLAWIDKFQGRETYGDGISFPEMRGMWRLGAKFEGVIEFPEAKSVGGEV